MADGITWAVAGRALHGEARSGDAAAIVARPDGVLLAAIDGLGHGDEAADAAERARELIEANAHDDLGQLVQRCHAGLAGMRGAAVTMGELRHDGTLSWVAVGNVEGAVVRADRAERRRRVDTVLHHAGVVGVQLPPLRVQQIDVGPHDVLVLATDGLATAFLDDLATSWSPQVAADWIVRRHARPNDDALVIVARRDPA
jgi:hypothetical protein